MTKNALLYTSAILLAVLFLTCKNNSVSKNTGDTQATDSLPAERTDSLVGFKGCNRAGFKDLFAGSHEFKYQYHTFKITSKETPGDLIEITIDSTKKQLRIPDAEATYFRGLARGHFFVDIGSAPDMRELIIYNLDNGTLRQVYRTPYLLEEEPFIVNGSLWFFVPVEESEVTQMPDCPDKAAWLEKGLRVGYGQRYLYNMINRGLARKSEFLCVPLQ